MNLQVVWFGYEDYRNEHPVPFGFAIKTDEFVSVHQRIDLENLQLPSASHFVMRNLGRTIIGAYKDKGNNADLHEFLLSNIFCTRASLRCWEVIHDRVPAEQFDAYVSGFMNQIDSRMAEHTKELTDYMDTGRRWQRFPEFAGVPEISSDTLEAACR